MHFLFLHSTKPLIGSCLGRALPLPNHRMFDPVRVLAPAWVVRGNDESWLSLPGHRVHPEVSSAKDPTG